MTYVIRTQTRVLDVSMCLGIELTKLKTLRHLDTDINYIYFEFFYVYV